MAINTFKKSNPNQVLESKVKDSQENMFEFALSVTKDMDFTTFDVLSITRADMASSYTYKTIHRKVNTQAERVAAQNARIIPWPTK